MTISYRDLRYVRVGVDDLDAASQFATDVFGLQEGDRDETHARFRSDARNYALCYSIAGEENALALTVGRAEDLDAVEKKLSENGYEARRLTDAETLSRQVKAGLAARAPNGIMVEVVWRPMTSGWRYHGPRDAGITGFQAVSLAATDIAADEAFWTNGLGVAVSDWVGDAVFLRIDAAHHRIAIYPSATNGILGAAWAVEGVNNVMQNWYFLQGCQLPIVHGPGRQPTSGAVFVTTRGPGGLLYSYAADMDEGPPIAERGPRQFPDTALSHCAWGSPTDQPEFRGESEI